MKSIGHAFRRITSSTRFRLVTLVVLSTLATGVVLGAAMIQQARSAMQEQLLQSHVAAARLAAQLAAREIGDAQAVARDFAGRPTVLPAIESDDAESLRPELERLMELHAGIDSVGIYDMNGLRLISGATSPQNAGVSSADRDWFQQARDTRAPYLGLPTLSRATGQATVPYSVPLLDRDGQVRAVLVAGVSLASLSNDITSINTGANVRRTLIDVRNGGTIVAHPDPSRILTAVSSVNPATSRVLAGESGTMLATNSTGELDLAAFTAVPGLPWGVLILQPVLDAFAPIRAATARATAFAGVVITLSVLLVLGGVYLQLTARMRALETAATRWSQRDWDHRTGLTGRDELSQLGVTFDAMADELQLHDRRRADAEEARAHLAAIVETADDAIISTTVDGLIESWNAGATALFGYTKDEIVGQPITLIIPPDRIQEHRDLEQPVQAGARANQIDTFRRAKDGRQIAVSITLTQTTDASGELRGFAAILRDISERRALERLKDEFASTVSHELRTPLNGVIGMTDLLLAMELAPQQRQYAEMINASGNVLLGLINDILDYSKIEAGRLDFEDTALNLRELIEEVVAIMSSEANRKGLELRTQCALAVPDWVTGDPGRIRQVLINLVGNAVKFTHEGEIRVYLDVAEETADSVLVRCEIVDTGVGIPMRAQRRLFEAFSQADSSTTRVYGGTGLGLVICKRLCALMGGSIGVESAPGQGSRFWFTVRCGRALAPAMPPSAPSFDTNVPPAGPARGEDNTHRAAIASGKVLIVEDSRVNQQVALGMLSRLGYTADIATNGHEAVDAMANRRYVAVLMDCQMPVMDGYAATAAIRQQETTTGRTPIIGFTANAMAGDRERCLAAGMDDYLAKPVKLQDLEAVLSRWVTTDAEASGPSDSEAVAETRVPSAGLEGIGNGAANGSDPVLDPGALASLRSHWEPGKPDPLRELVLLFLNEAPPRVRAMEAAAAEQDVRAMSVAAHALKGEASIFGARELQALCTQLEIEASAGRIAASPEVVERLVLVFDRTRSALEAAIADPAAP